MSATIRGANELRPNTLSEIIGQQETVKVLDISVRAAKGRGEALGHCLLDGGPGLGKTSLAVAVGNDMGVPVQVANGPAIRSIKHVLPYLSRLTTNSILFVDEIHRVVPMVQEFLYTAMEDYKVYLTSKDTNPVTMELPRFTLIAATTEAGSISRPLYDRFMIHQHLRYYTTRELTILIRKNAGLLMMDISEDAAEILAGASRGTPRVANNLLRWVRDFAAVGSVIRTNAVVSALTTLGVERNGLDAQDKKYLEALEHRFNGGPAGLATLAAATGLTIDTLTGTIEPYLLRENLIDKTPLGRVLK